MKTCVERAGEVLAPLPREPLVQAEASVPTRHGVFRFLVFHAPGDPSTDHVALVAGDVEREDVLVRVHSECMTSEVFGSLHCDQRARSSMGRRRRSLAAVRAS